MAGVGAASAGAGLGCGGRRAARSDDHGQAETSASASTPARAVIRNSHGGAHASTAFAPIDPLTEVPAGRFVRDGRQPASSNAEDRCESLDRGSGDRIDHELDVADALASVGAQLLGHRLRVALERSDRSASWRCRPSSRPVPPGMRTWTATVRSISAGSRPTSRHAASTFSRSAGDARRRRCAVSAYHEFHASTWGAVIRSIRSPFDPIISGGPPGSRAARQQLAVAGLVVRRRRSRSRRRGGGRG